MRQYNSLAAHNAACNELFFKYQDCKYEHPYRKFLGYCNDIEKQMTLCIKEQLEINRAKNKKLSEMRRTASILKEEEKNKSTV